MSFDAYGYAVVFISNIATAIYLATIARIGSTFGLFGNLLLHFLFSSLTYFVILTDNLSFSGKSSGLNSFGLMWCNGKIKGSKQN